MVFYKSLYIFSGCSFKSDNELCIGASGDYMSVTRSSKSFIWLTSKMSESADSLESQSDNIINLADQDFNSFFWLVDNKLLKISLAYSCLLIRVITSSSFSILFIPFLRILLCWLGLIQKKADRLFSFHFLV